LLTRSRAAIVISFLRNRSQVFDRLRLTDQFGVPARVAHAPALAHKGYGDAGVLAPEMRVHVHGWSDLSRPWRAPGLAGVAACALPTSKMRPKLAFIATKAAAVPAAL
jgi:hypothetical protein